MCGRRKGQGSGVTGSLRLCDQLPPIGLKKPNKQTIALSNSAALLLSSTMLDHRVPAGSLRANPSRVHVQNVYVCIVNAECKTNGSGHSSFAWLGPVTALTSAAGTLSRILQVVHLWVCVRAFHQEVADSTGSCQYSPVSPTPPHIATSSVIR